MMAVGWMAFLGSWLMNVLFYMVHPSAVDCSKKGVKEKLFIHVQGKKQFLWGYRDSKGYYTYNIQFIFCKLIKQIRQKVSQRRNPAWTK